MVILATSITALFAGWLSNLSISQTIKILAPAPSPFLIFLILYWVFDNWLWKWPTFRWLFKISEPNLAGKWKGKLKSNTHDKELYITLHIKQRWSKISIATAFDKSTSSSFSASIHCTKALPELIYNYDNIPHKRESETMTRHIGTTELRLIDSNTLTGNYFTSGDRKSDGWISVSRVLQT